MKFDKLPTITLAAAGFAVLAAAPDAQACEDCLPTQSGWTCWSGQQSGVGSCWGGGENYCSVEGSCSGTDTDPGCIYFGDCQDCDPGWEYCPDESWDDWECVYWCNC